jgi:hypothetical protein
MLGRLPSRSRLIVAKMAASVHRSGPEGVGEGASRAIRFVPHRTWRWPSLRPSSGRPGGLPACGGGGAGGRDASGAGAATALSRAASAVTERISERPGTGAPRPSQSHHTPDAVAPPGSMTLRPAERPCIDLDKEYQGGVGASPFPNWPPTLPPKRTVLTRRVTTATIHSGRLRCCDITFSSSRAPVRPVLAGVRRLTAVVESCHPKRADRPTRSRDVRGNLPQIAGAHRGRRKAAEAGVMLAACWAPASEPCRLDGSLARPSPHAER